MRVLVGSLLIVATGSAAAEEEAGATAAAGTPTTAPATPAVRSTAPASQAVRPGSDSPAARDATGAGTRPSPTREVARAEPAPVATAGVDRRHYRPNQSPYRVWLGVEMPLLAVAGVITGVPRLMVAEQSGPWCGLACDRDALNPLDRPVTTWRSQAASDASDYLVWGFLPLPLVLNLVDVMVSEPGDGWRGYWTDAFVMAETLLVSSYLSSVASLIARRPRPYVYNDTVDDDFRQEGEAAMSFYSGHTSSVFAVATAYSRLFMLRHPGSPYVVPVWVSTYAVATTVGILRVASGSHFPTDVLVGAAAGVGVGLLIPWLHELPREEDGARGAQAGRLRIRPYVTGLGAGLHGSF